MSTRIIFRILLMIICCLVLFKDSMAQINGTLEGRIYDSKRPLEFVTIRVFNKIDSSKVAYQTLSDSLGYYKISQMTNGNYNVRFSLVGYKAYTKAMLLTTKNPNVLIDPIQLENNIKQMKSVTISTQKKLIEKTAEGFVVNASANITQAGGTVLDILRNTPTISVDAEDAISMRGKSPMLLINGKNSAIINLNQIPASSIESIEIINSATAKYDANAQSGIINIRLKKNKQNGTNGAIGLGIGYGAKARANSSILLNHKNKKWNFGIGYDNRFAGRTKKISSERTNFFLSDVNLISQLRNDKRLEQLQNLKLNIDFSPNTKNNFSLEIIGNSEGQDNNESLNSTIYKVNHIFNLTNNRSSLELERSKVAELALDYEHKFSDDRKSLTASITSSFNHDRQNTTITTQAFNEDLTNLGSAILQRTHNYENENISNVKIDYAFPLYKKMILETGYKATYRLTNDDYESAEQINNVYVRDSLASNIFHFNESVQAMYFLISSPIGKKENSKWNYKIGLRAEQVSNQGNTDNNSKQFTNNYLKFFPTTTISYQKSETAIFKLSYGKRINRPELDELNPFIDITDALNPHSGNPYLKPEIIHAIELNYDKTWKSSSLSSTLFYRYSLHTISRYLQMQGNGVNIALPINLGNSSTAGFESIFTKQVNSIYDFNVSVSLYQQHIDASVNAIDLVQNALGGYGKWINNFAINSKMKFQAIGNYNSSLITAQGKRLNQYSVDLGFQQKIGKGNARFSLTVVDVFNSLKSGYSANVSEFKNTRTSKADTRAVMIMYAHSFRTSFKEKLLNNQFSKEY